MAQLIVINQTNNTVSYLSGQFTVNPTSQSLIDFGLVPYLSLDPGFKNDLLNNNVLLSDSINIYQGANAISYLNTWIMKGPPQNSNDPVSFTLAGKGFSVTGSATLNSSTETPVLLLTNPSTSSINARAIYFYAAPNSTQGIVNISIYTNPTVTSNGTQIPTSNNLVSASAPSSSMIAYAAPSVTSNGASRITMVTNSNADFSLFNFAQTAIMAPGNSMLMTVTINNLGLLSNVTTYFYLQWVEA